MYVRRDEIAIQGELLLSSVTCGRNCCARILLEEADCCSDNLVSDENVRYAAIVVSDQIDTVQCVWKYVVDSSRSQSLLLMYLQ